MIWQLVKKELREIGWIAAVAMGLLLLVVAYLMGYKLIDFIITPNETREVPFVGPSYNLICTWILILLALSLGLFQSLLEEHHGTYLFLLHRPAARSTISGIRITIGIVLCLLCAFVPIIVYGCWASIPGNNPAPFEWSMAESAVRLGLVTPIVYLGAFLSGFRRARWIGSRLFPVLSASIIGFIMAFIPQVWLCYLTQILFMVLLTIQIMHIAKIRDYT